jgi:hypothetical protein
MPNAILDIAFMVLFASLAASTAFPLSYRLPRFGTRRRVGGNAIAALNKI